MLAFMIVIFIIFAILFLMLADCMSKPLKEATCKPEIKHEYIDNDLRL